MKLLADLHIARATVAFLRRLGHDVVRVCDVLPSNASDAAIVAMAARHQRVILTQDLDFSGLVARGRWTHPSVQSLRLSSSRIEHVNAVLIKVLPAADADLLAGAVVSVEDTRIRLRRPPIS